MEEYFNKLVENTLKKDNAKDIIVERILWYEMRLLEKDEEIERLNNIINKAIEYINKNKWYFEDDEYVFDDMLEDVKPLLDILKGEDKK